MDTSNNKNNPPVGFSETLHKVSQPSNNSCRDIFKKGKNVNNAFFFPSEFPKITKTKSFLGTVKGGRRRRKYVRKSRRRLSK